ncbi:MAG: hypothetical protein M1835_005057 [Candelina submexicana]|nr:MAG: hypothetical protein M1835_005057 [Candelina submexicana]
MSLSAIPTELLVKIFAYHNNKSDIKSVRLVCNAFERAASQYLFPRVYLSPHRLHLQILQAVSQHPVFSRYVREIVYDASYFDPDIDDTLKYREKLSLQFQRSKAGGLLMPSEAIISEGFLKYRTHVIEQENYWSWDSESKFLCSAIRLLPKVDQITVIDHWDTESDLTEENEVYYSTPLARRWQLTTLKPVSWYDDFKLSNPIAVRPPERVARLIPRSRFFLVLAQAFARESNDQIRHLVLARPALLRSMPLEVFECISRIAPQDVSNTFRNLKTLDLELHTARWLDVEWDPMSPASAVTPVLTAATGLKSLKIGFSNGPLGGSPGLGYLLGSGTWKSLQIVELTMMPTTEDDLLGFLERHRRTLRRLGLVWVGLEGSTWPLCVENIKKLSLQLDVFHLDFAVDLDNDGTRADEVYPRFLDSVFEAFLYRGGPNPLVGVQMLHG